MTATLSYRRHPLVAFVDVAGTVAERELLRLKAQPSVLVSQALQLVFFLLVYAVGLAGTVGNQSSFSAYVFPGIATIMAVNAGVSAGITFAWDREFGFMREMMVAPAPRLALCVGKTAGVTAQTMALGAVFLLFGPVLHVPLSLPRYLLGLLGLGLTSIVFCLLGLAAAVTVRRVELLQSVIQLVMYPMLFLSGSVFDPSASARWLDIAVHLNPMTYGVDLIRRTLLSTSRFHPAAPVAIDLLVLAGAGLIAFGLIGRKVGR